MSWLNRTHIGDCRELLERMAADGVRVQTCVTSPPYCATTARRVGPAAILTAIMQHPQLLRDLHEQPPVRPAGQRQSMQAPYSAVIVSVALGESIHRSGSRTHPSPTSSSW